MKRKLLVLSMLMTGLMTGLAGIAEAGRTRASAGILPSCDPCTTSDNITFRGTGFKQGVQVYLTVEGPVSHTITVTIDNSGGFFTDFGGLTTYEAGSYTVEAYSISGKRSALVASTAFDVN